MISVIDALVYGMLASGVCVFLKYVWDNRLERLSPGERVQADPSRFYEYLINKEKKTEQSKAGWIICHEKPYDRKSYLFQGPAVLVLRDRENAIELTQFLARIEAAKAQHGVPMKFSIREVTPTEYNDSFIWLAYSDLVDPKNWINTLHWVGDEV